MRQIAIISTAFVFVAAPGIAAADAPQIEDAFSPRQGATEMIVHAIDSARSSIQVAAYSFTSRPIGDALAAAYRRGVNVRIVVDKRQDSFRSLVYSLSRGGIPIRIDRQYAIMHNKFMIIDNESLELGSFNYTRAAELHNAENAIVIRNAPAIIADYSFQWRKLWNESGNPTVIAETK